ncbi:putative ribonuclease H-like domain-containing protein [Tanacetum coccineum]
MGVSQLDYSPMTVNVGETSSKAMVAIDGAGFDWSYMADDEVPTNMALMDFSNSELEKLKQEKESNQLKVEIFDNASKSLDKLIGLFSLPKFDLSNSGLEEFQQPEFEGYRPKTSKSVIEVISNVLSQSPRGNQRNWNNQKFQQLGSDFVMYNKACFVCGSFDHVQADCNYHQRERVISGNNYTRGHPQKEDQGYVDSGCSRHMTGNLSYLSNFKEFDGGYDGYFIKELQFNLFSISEMCDKKNNVLFTNTGCFVLSPDFKLADESQVLLKVPRKNNMYSVDMKNIVPKESLTCLVAKATLNESMLWHRRLGHVNYKTINKLVKENLVRGLPTKCFEHDQTCVACLKGKQHKASCRSKIQNSITQPLFMLHMDLFGPTFMSSLMNKKYYLVVTDDYSRFTWVFFLASKDETSGIVKRLITEIENIVDKKVKIIRCDNGTEFKNRVMSEFYEEKVIKKEFSETRTP